MCTLYVSVLCILEVSDFSSSRLLGFKFVLKTLHFQVTNLLQLMQTCHEFGHQGGEGLGLDTAAVWGLCEVCYIRGLASTRIDYTISHVESLIKINRYHR